MEKGQRVPVCSVNLSGQSLSDEHLLDYILDYIYEGGEISPELLCFEITETAVVANIDSAMHMITELRGIGVKFALDDFGSGMSSFGYLKNLPVDFLKIDGQFIMNLKDDSKDHSVVKAINEIGHVMGIKTIAEFVEDDHTLELLKMLKVDYAQGYGIGIPEPIDDVDFGPECIEAAC
jgi:EAL domain-containing protein (putative c-di-GMP-specific phosphodiesterase class I)